MTGSTQHVSIVGKVRSRTPRSAATPEAGHLLQVAVGEGLSEWCFAVPEEFTTTERYRPQDPPEPERLDDQGIARKVHYGEGRQPWDDIMEAGWGPAFAAANVLKYLRRNKSVEDSRKKAMWYWHRLTELAQSEKPRDRVDGTLALSMLVHKLSNEEFALLKAGRV